MSDEAYRVRRRLPVRRQGRAGRPAPEVFAVASTTVRSASRKSPEEAARAVRRRRYPLDSRHLANPTAAEHHMAAPLSLTPAEYQRYFQDQQADPPSRSRSAGTCGRVLAEAQTRAAIRRRLRGRAAGEDRVHSGTPLTGPHGGFPEFEIDGPRRSTALPGRSRFLRPASIPRGPRRLVACQERAVRKRLRCRAREEMAQLEFLRGTWSRVTGRLVGAGWRHMDAVRGGVRVLLRAGGAASSRSYLPRNDEIRALRQASRSSRGTPLSGARTELVHSDSLHGSLVTFVGSAVPDWLRLRSGDHASAARSRSGRKYRRSVQTVLVEQEAAVRRQQRLDDRAGRATGQARDRLGAAAPRGRSRGRGPGLSASRY